MLPNCDCGAVDETDHLDVCIRGVASELLDVAEEVAMEDGYRPSRGASLIKHPTHAKTRAHRKAHPFPKQDGRRTA